MLASAKTHANHKVKSAVNDIEEGEDHVKRAARAAANHAHNDLDSIAHNFGGHMREFVESAGEGIAHAKGSITDATDLAAKKIRRKPMMAIAVALGVGVVMGALLRRSA